MICAALKAAVPSMPSWPLYAGIDARVRKSGQSSGKIKMSKPQPPSAHRSLSGRNVARLHEPRLVAEVSNHHKHKGTNITAWPLWRVTPELVGIIYSVCAAAIYDPQKYAQPSDSL